MAHDGPLFPGYVLEMPGMGQEMIKDGQEMVHDGLEMVRKCQEMPENGQEMVSEWSKMVRKWSGNHPPHFYSSIFSLCSNPPYGQVDRLFQMGHGATYIPIFDGLFLV